MVGSRKVVAGLGDAGFAALGTFLAGIIAVRQLSTPALAVYAVVFSAAVLAMLLPRQTHYIPAQLSANLEQGLVAPVVGRDLRRAAGASALAGVVVLVLPLTLVAHAPLWVCLALGLSGAAYTVISPMQDHVRGSLHLVDRHLSAAACSVVGACVVGAGAVIAFAGQSAWWIVLVPFGALAVANLVSLATGLLLLRRSVLHHEYVEQSRTVRFRYLFAEVAVQAAWLGCNYAILTLIDAVSLAHLEAARVISSPVQVLVAGLLTFMGPLMVRRLVPSPAHPRGPRTAFTAVVVLLVVTAGAYIGLLALFGLQVGELLDKPFELGLWAARIGAALIEGLASIGVFLLFATGRTRMAVANSVVTGAVGLLGTVFLALVIGPFALPVGQSLGMGFRLVNSMRLVDHEVTRAGEREAAVV